MVRIAAVAAVLGLAGAFRLEQKRDSNDAPRVRVCSLSGDPHVHFFDGGRRFDPMFAAGHFWIVKTETEKIQVQGTYSYCGRKRQRGNTPTCLMGIAVGGSFVGGNTLSVEAPCEYDYETGKCRSKARSPIIKYNGQAVNTLNEQGMKVTVRGRSIKLELPESMRIELNMHGTKYFNSKIYMAQGSGGAQCGHCGNFDGKQNNDLIYDKAGQLLPQFEGGIKGGEPFCDANVHCPDRIIKGDPLCAENEEEDEEKDDCSPAMKDRFYDECRDKLEGALDMKGSKLPAEVEEDDIQECVLDACRDQGFIDDDVEDAVDDIGDIKAGLKGMGM